jgi:FO synthase
MAGPLIVPRDWFRPTLPIMAPASSALRRALARVERGVSLDAGEAETLLGARGEDLDRLLKAASGVRDAGLASAGRAGIITYSRKVFIPLTRLCRDRCHYCTFVAAPSALVREGQPLYLSLDEVVKIAREGAALGCKEALFTLGDRPEDRWPQAAQWLEERGYASTLEYVRAAAIRVLEETGLLPHLNPGVMSWEEMHHLRPVAASMGMMLETSSERLFSTPGEVHFGSPDKDPAVRMRTIDDAGRLGIPFTTGLLLGIGETPQERVESLFAIRRSAREFGHIREVIIQNFRSKPHTASAERANLDHETYLASLAVSRLVLGPGIRIQAPPNLTDEAELGDLLRAGIDDWGGISPLTPDHVNPERPWPHIELVADVCRAHGFELRERLAAHPEHVLDLDPWFDSRIHGHVLALAGSDGLAADVLPTGRAWQELGSEATAYEDFALHTDRGRSNLNSEIDEIGRLTEQRSDVDSVYGDWSEIAKRSTTSASQTLDGAIKRGLALAESDPSALADESNEDAAVALMSASGPALELLCEIADQLRRERVGEEVTYVVNRNINFTNVCYTGCRFCAFAQRRTDADAFTLSLQEIAERVREASEVGATEICMQGGIHPDLPGTAYFDLARAVKAEAPSIHLHAFSPMEVVNGAMRSGMSIREWLIAAKESGVDSIPGTAAEILDDEVRLVLTKGKLPTRSWVEVIKTAHEIGLPSSSTMMYGHVDGPKHRVGHIRLIRRIQEETGGFTEFVPLPFVHHNSPIYLAGIARAGSTRDEDLAVHAMGRLMLDGQINNVQVSWVKLGTNGAASMLSCGANDLGGTLMEETISRMAGSTHGSQRLPEELVAIAELAGRPARERTTTYGVPSSLQVGSIG